MVRGEEGWVARLPAASPCQQSLGVHVGYPAVPNGAAASWALPRAPRRAAPSLCWLNSAGLIELAQLCHSWGARGESGHTARGCPDAVPGGLCQETEVCGGSSAPEQRPRERSGEV